MTSLDPASGLVGGRSARFVAVSKALAYYTRHADRSRYPKGTVWYDGAVRVSDLLKLKDLVKLKVSKAEVAHVVDQSFSQVTGVQRFSIQIHDGELYVRSNYGQTQLGRTGTTDHHLKNGPSCSLQVLAARTIAKNITRYPDRLIGSHLDDHGKQLILTIIRNENRLSSKTIKPLLGVRLETLDLGGIVVSPNLVMKIASTCPDLRTLNLRGCGTMTDHMVSQIVCKCKKLEVLNISGTCSSLSRRSYDEISTHATKLRELGLQGARIRTEEIMKLIDSLPELMTLDLRRTNAESCVLEKIREVLFPRRKQWLLRQGIIVNRVDRKFDEAGVEKVVRTSVKENPKPTAVIAAISANEHKT